MSKFKCDSYSGTAIICKSKTVVHCSTYTYNELDEEKYESSVIENPKEIEITSNESCEQSCGVEFTIPNATADKIDATIGRNKGKQGSTKRVEEIEERPEKFEAYKGKKRKPGAGYVKQISANSWQGRYTPTIDGKRVSMNIYAPTEEECERKLAEKIAGIKEEIKASKQSGITMI